MRDRIAAVFSSLLYLLLSRLLGMLVSRDRAAEQVRLENLVLRHQVAMLRSHSIGPAPRRGPTWSQFLKAQAQGIIACDFFTVETTFLKTLYVLFFIEIGSRRVRVSVATSSPNSVFVTQQARNLAMSRSDECASIRFLIRDRDAKFSRSFEDVFASEGIRVIRTPIRAPNANAFAERWVETLRA